MEQQENKLKRERVDLLRSRDHMMDVHRSIEASHKNLILEIRQATGAMGAISMLQTEAASTRLSSRNVGLSRQPSALSIESTLSELKAEVTDSNGQ